MAVVSLAFEPGAAFWDSAFALADHIDRADPARAELRRFARESICSRPRPARGPRLTCGHTCEA